MVIESPPKQSFATQTIAMEESHDLTAGFGAPPPINRNLRKYRGVARLEFYRS